MRTARPLRRHQRRPSRLDDESRADAILRCIGNRDWSVLHRHELESLEQHLERIDGKCGSDLHNTVRERLGLGPRRIDWW